MIVNDDGTQNASGTTRHVCQLKPRLLLGDKHQQGRTKQSPSQTTSAAEASVGMVSAARISSFMLASRLTTDAATTNCSPKGASWGDIAPSLKPCSGGVVINVVCRKLPEETIKSAGCVWQEQGGLYVLGKGGELLSLQCYYLTFLYIEKNKIKNIYKKKTVSLTNVINLCIGQVLRVSELNLFLIFFNVLNFI